LELLLTLPAPVAGGLFGRSPGGGGGGGGGPPNPGIGGGGGGGPPPKLGRGGGGGGAGILSVDGGFYSQEQ